MKKKSLFLLSMAAVTLTACSDKENDLPANNEQVEITLTSSIEQTRSTNTTLQKDQLANGATVGVYVVDKDSKDIAENSMLTANGAGSLSGDAVYFPKEGDVSIYAYAPYNSAWAYGEDVTFTVKTNQSSDEGYIASDLLYGVPTASTNSFNKGNTDPIALLFTHKLAKVTINVTVEDSEYDLTGRTVNITNTLPSVAFNSATGVLGETSGTATSIKAATFASDATTFAASAVIVPQTVASGTDFIQIVLEDKALSAKLPTATTFASGKSYNFTVKISGNKAEILLSTSVTDWEPGQEFETDIEETELPAITFSPDSFVALSSNQNATYENGVYEWSASSNNLMTILEFTEGELAQYNKLEVTTSNLADGSNWRMGYVIDGGSYTNFPEAPYYSAGTKTVDLKALAASGVDLSKVTKIQIGGNSGTGSIEIAPSNVVLKGVQGGTSTETPDDNNGNDNNDNNDNNGNNNNDNNDNNDILTATFSTPGNNASYTGTTYAWTGSTSNLMTIFEFSNGELAGYTTLTFTFSDLVDGPVRMGYYVGSEFTEFGNGYYSAGTKTVNLSEIGIDLSTVTKIAFGGRSSAGSCTIIASDCILSK